MALEKEWQQLTEERFWLPEEKKAEKYYQHNFEFTIFSKIQI